MQAALAFAASYAIGAAMPLVAVLIMPADKLIAALVGASIILLALLGALGAYMRGAPPLRAALRATLWGALAMAIIAGVGALFGAIV